MHVGHKIYVMHETGSFSGTWGSSPKLGYLAIKLQQPTLFLNTHHDSLWELNPGLGVYIGGTSPLSTSHQFPEIYTLMAVVSTESDFYR